jgi:hypothetical protein
MSKTVQQLKSVTKRIALGGNAEARQRHTSKNKLLARDRVDKLVDPKYVLTRFLMTRRLDENALVRHSSNYRSWLVINCMETMTYLQLDSLPVSDRSKGKLCGSVLGRWMTVMF